MVRPAQSETERMNGGATVVDSHTARPSQDRTMSAPTPPSAKPLMNSQRVAYKATYAPAILDTKAPPGRALEKAAFIRRLGPTPQEVALLRQGRLEVAPTAVA